MSLTHEFGAELLELLRRYEGRGLANVLGCSPEFVEEEPVLDEATGIRWARRRRGPVTRVSLTLVDTTIPATEPTV